MRHLDSEGSKSTPAILHPGVLLPRDIWLCQGTVWAVTTGDEALLTSTARRPGLMLNILECTGQPHPTSHNKGFSSPKCQQRPDPGALSPQITHTEKNPESPGHWAPQHTGLGLPLLPLLPFSFSGSHVPGEKSLRVSQEPCSPHHFLKVLVSTHLTGGQKGGEGLSLSPRTLVPSSSEHRVLCAPQGHLLRPLL